MKIQRAVVWTVVCAALLMSGVLNVSAEEKPKSNEQDAAMMEMMKYAAPGEAHKVLEPLVGSWSCTSRMWMKPGDKAEESKGTSEHTWIYGGRFLSMDFKADWNGQVMEGVDFLGYDNFRGEYQLASLNNMMTSIMHTGGGVYNADSKTLTLEGNFACPMTGEKEKWMRSEWKILDKDKLTYTGTFKDQDGKEYKAMEIIYNRVK